MTTTTPTMPDATVRSLGRHIANDDANNYEKYDIQLGAVG